MVRNNPAHHFKRYSWWARPGSGPAAACSAEGIDPGMEQRLAESNVWAMFLSPQGKRLWGANLPGGLPEEYTVQQVAVFAKGYLAGYPVFLQTAEDGLLVLGYPQGSYTKLTRNYWPMAFKKALPGCAAVMLGADLALLFASYFFSKRKILKATGPLLEAVEALAKGKRIDLKMWGELVQDEPAEAYGANERLESRHGLGLALVQRIAQAHGGCIKIESGSEKGCEVTLLFPWEAE